MSLDSLSDHSGIYLLPHPDPVLPQPRGSWPLLELWEPLDPSPRLCLGFFWCLWGSTDPFSEGVAATQVFQSLVATGSSGFAGFFFSWDLQTPWTRPALRSTQGPPCDPWRSRLNPCGGPAVDHRALGICSLPSMEGYTSQAQILWDLLALICIGIYLLIPNPGGTCGVRAPWCSTPPLLTLLDPL